METKQILKIQPTEENPVIVENYPYGFKRTKIKYWVESVNKKGDRFCAQTLNPKTNLWNKPKKSTYSAVIIVYKNLENNHIKGYYFSRGTNTEEYNKFTEFVGEIEFNEIQKEELRVLRAYIKTYENVSFEFKPQQNKTEEEQKKHDDGQKEIKSQIRKTVVYNYNHDNGVLN